MNVGFAFAAAVSFIGLGIHLFYGGARVIRPFLASDARPMVKALLYYCWHGVTLTVAAMAAVFTWAAQSYLAHAAALAFGCLAAALSLAGLWVAGKTKVSLLKFVPMYLFAAIAAGAFWGFFGSMWDIAVHGGLK
jgi:hypothetical protein